MVELIPGREERLCDVVASRCVLEWIEVEARHDGSDMLKNFGLNRFVAYPVGGLGKAVYLQGNAIFVGFETPYHK